MTTATTITLDDGRIFPAYQGKALCWSVGLYMTTNEAMCGYPKAKTVIAAMRAHRPDELERERREMLKASFNRMFGHNAKTCLALIEG